MEKENRILIKNADWIITMDQQRGRFRNADILIQGNRIIDIGMLGEIEQIDEVIDARGFIIIPGMINTHHHCSHTLIRNMPDIVQYSLSSFLKLIYGKLEYMSERGIYAATLGALGDLLKTGCTTSCDHHYVFPPGNNHMIDMQIKAAEKIGIRFHAFRGSLSAGAENDCLHVPPSLIESADRIVKDSVRLIEQYHDPSPGAMIRIGVAPCWLVYEKKDVILQSLKIAEHYNVQFHSHLADSRSEFSYANEKHGCTPVEFAEKLGCLKPQSYFAHCVQLTKQDYAILAKNKAGVAHCPNSDLLLNTGIANVPEFFRRGVHVSLGVDGSTCNNASIMISELKNAFLVQKFSEKQPFISPERVLYMATAGGAQVLGRKDIGSLAPNMMADFVMLNWNKFQYAGGKNDPISAVVLSSDPRIVDYVFVNGKMVVKHGILTQIDESKAAAFINQEADLLMSK
ncbi:MAG: amidohydrolase family protein [Bacillota bacterium]